MEFLSVHWLHEEEEDTLPHWLGWLNEAWANGWYFPKYPDCSVSVCHHCVDTGGETGFTSPLVKRTRGYEKILGFYLWKHVGRTKPGSHYFWSYFLPYWSNTERDGHMTCRDVSFIQWVYHSGHVAPVLRYSVTSGVPGRVSTEVEDALSIPDTSSCGAVGVRLLKGQYHDLLSWGTTPCILRLRQSWTVT